MSQVKHEQDGEQGVSSSTGKKSQDRLKIPSGKYLDVPGNRKRANISGVLYVEGKLVQGTGKVKNKGQMMEVLLAYHKSVPFV